MTLDPRQLLLRPRGRIERPSFLIGVVLLVALSWAATAILRWLDPATASGFWFGLVFFVSYPFFIYSVFGQRLHDMGRSVWPLTGVIALIFVVFIAVALAYGGAEYTSEYAQFDRKEVIDPDVVRELDTAYQTELAAGGEQTARRLLGAIMILFTLWLAISPGQPEENRYGFPPS